MSSHQILDHQNWERLYQGAGVEAGVAEVQVEVKADQHQESQSAIAIHMICLRTLTSQLTDGTSIAILQSLISILSCIANQRSYLTIVREAHVLLSQHQHQRNCPEKVGLKLDQTYRKQMWWNWSFISTSLLGSVDQTTVDAMPDSSISNPLRKKHLEECSCTHSKSKDLMS